MIDKIKYWIQKQKEKRFWNNPDKWLVAVILDDNNEQVYGKVKNGLAILERIPKPETGYFYLDIVKVVGPIGKQAFRDEEIEVFKAIEIYKSSNIPTFTFKAILPKPNDYFRLLDWFKQYDKKVEFPWSPKDYNLEWRKGYCTADNLEQATKILLDFVQLDRSRDVKEVNNWDYYLKE
ncbi:hypothetical protein [Paludibacter propionicigenes]|nr:hypothetical protein [Paludibacter propionicigenes]